MEELGVEWDVWNNTNSLTDKWKTSQPTKPLQQQHKECSPRKVSQTPARLPTVTACRFGICIESLGDLRKADC